LAYGHIAAAHGWFHRIRRVANFLHGFLAHMSSRSSGISIGSAVLQGSPVPSRQTDHGTCDVSSDKPHLGDAYDAAQNKATILHEILLVSYDTGLDKA